MRGYYRMAGMAKRTERAKIAVSEMPKRAGMAGMPEKAGMAGMAGESNGAANRHSGMHGQIGMPTNGASSAHGGMHRQIGMAANSAGGAHDDGAMHAQPGGMHGQTGMSANSACGMHATSGGAMRKTRAGANTRGDGAMHAESAGELDGIADRHSSMHAQIGMLG